ncbi:MAG: isochorismatase family protein [bacterium]|nr:isochorismatase family protein [bacterium]
MLNALRLDADQAMLLVIDVQTKLLPAIDRHDDVSFNVQQLLRGADIFELPVLATEQYPRGIGPTVEPVADLLTRLRAQVIEKHHFSVCGAGAVREALNAIDRPEVIVCGIEAHVCVLQTALDLVLLGHRVYVCADAVGSQFRQDWQWSLSRMQQAGIVVTTTEAALFELAVECRTPQFKQLLECIKASRARGQ